MNGYERLKELYKSGQNKDTPLIAIIKHLLKQSNMSELYLKEEKNLKQMVEFINDKAKEQAINNVAIVEDEIVYGWAVEYFSKSNEELGINKPKPATPPKAENKPKEEDKSQLTLEIA